MIISNATPLIAFARIGQLGLLRKVVLKEMKKQGVYFSQRFIDAVLFQLGE